MRALILVSALALAACADPATRVGTAENVDMSSWPVDRCGEPIRPGTKGTPAGQPCR